jgi:hypothetical protein
VSVPRPDQVAAFDQAHATVSESLDALVSAYRASLADGEPVPLTICGQGVWLRQNMTGEALAEHLTVAIARLAAQGIRCPNCDHVVTTHGEGGCWFTLTHTMLGENLVCGCEQVGAWVPP